MGGIFPPKFFTLPAISTPDIDDITNQRKTLIEIKNKFDFLFNFNKLYLIIR